VKKSQREGFFRCLYPVRSTLHTASPQQQEEMSSGMGPARVYTVQREGFPRVPLHGSRSGYGKITLYVQTS
jgi:hypothetical protein